MCIIWTINPCFGSYACVWAISRWIWAGWGQKWCRGVMMAEGKAGGRSTTPRFLSTSPPHLHWYALPKFYTYLLQPVQNRTDRHSGSHPEQMPRWVRITGWIVKFTKSAYLGVSRHFAKVLLHYKPAHQLPPAAAPIWVWVSGGRGTSQTIQHWTVSFCNVGFHNLTLD